MKLARQFNILACAAVLSAILSYCVADSKPLLGLLAIIACGIGFWAANEGRSLPRLLINILVLIAIADAAIGAGRHGGSIVSDLSKFLVYIQLIKLFDRRSPRDDAHLLSLSVFIVIGAVLTSNILGVGLFLLAYTPLAISAAMLLQLTGGLRSALATRPPGHASELSMPALGKTYRRSFRRTAGFAVTGTVVLAAVAFMVTPRGMGKDLMGNFGKLGPGAVTGFTEQITLGYSGLLSDSETPVLDMRVTDGEGREIGNLLGLVYLRAYAKDHYNRVSHTWDRSSNTGGYAAAIPRPEEPASQPISDGRGFETEPAIRPPGAPATTQPPGNEPHTAFSERITLRRTNSGGYLFTTWRTLQVDTPEGTSYPRTPDYEVSDKSLKISGGHYSYVVHWALDYTDPSAPSRSDVSFESKRVESLAREILSGRGISLTARPRGAAQTRIAANALQAYLRQNCTYTTEMFAPEHDEDPIEMFLFRTKKGHCEYFASAMVALCQSVGIDARIVAGYLASEYNSVSGEYIVRESNAHAWVEVEMEPGRWNTMDPSPPDVIARLHRPAGGILGRLRHLYEAMEFTWVNAVVTFDEKKRSELVGAGTGWSNALARVSRFFGDPSVSPDGGLSDRDLGLIVFGAILCGFAGWIGWREFRARRRNKLRVAGLADADPTLVALMTQAGFYDRAIRALERTGFSKPRYRPPLEHAGVLAGDHPELAGVLRSLGELYYRVRYARRALNDSETAAAEALVDRLTVLAAGPGPETREGDRAAV